MDNFSITKINPCRKCGASLIVYGKEYAQKSSDPWGDPAFRATCQECGNNSNFEFINENSVAYYLGGCFYREIPEIIWRIQALINWNLENPLPSMSGFPEMKGVSSDKGTYFEIKKNDNP